MAAFTADGTLSFLFGDESGVDSFGTTFVANAGFDDDDDAGCFDDDCMSGAGFIAGAVDATVAALMG